MHAGVTETVEGRIRIIGVIHAWYDHRRGAILQEVHLAGERRIALHDVSEQIVDGPSHTVALGFTGDDQHVELEKLVDERCVARHRGTVEQLSDLWAEDRVVLDPRVGPLHLKARLGSAGHTVEEAGLHETADQVVTLVTQHAVEGPDRERVTPPLVQLGGVVLEVALGRHEVGVERRCHERACLPRTVTYILVGHLGERRRVVAVIVDQEGRVEHGEHSVGIHGGEQLGEDAHVAVDELHHSLGILHRTIARPAGHEQLTVGVAERVLHVDVQQTNTHLIGDAGLQPVLLAPIERASHQSVVVDPPLVVDDVGGVVMRRQSK